MRIAVKNVLLNLLAAGAATALAACATIPKELQGEFAPVSPASVQPEVYGSSVRWGGVLVKTHNEKDHTCFEILSRPLDRSMRPVDEDITTGRFIACTNGFHDPAVYAKGREVTVTGHIKNVEVHKIADFDYRYPVVEITDMVLWQQRKDMVIYDPFYDPFFYPFYWGRPYWDYYPYYRYPGPYRRPRGMSAPPARPRGNAVPKHDR